MPLSLYIYIYIYIYMCILNCILKFRLILNRTDNRLVQSREFGWFNKIQISISLSVWLVGIFAVRIVFFVCVGFLCVCLPRVISKVTHVRVSFLPIRLLAFWQDLSFSIYCTSKKYISISFQIEWDMIMVTVFLLILNRINSIWFKIERKTVAMIISHSIW